MSDKERIVLYVSEPTAEEFRKQVAEMFGQTDGFASTAGEMALREWCDNDRAARIEDKLDRVLEGREDPPSETELERERDSDPVSNSPSPTAKRAAKIANELPPSTWVDDDVIKAKIGKHAGESFKTVQKYKERLVREGKLIPSPVETEEEWATEPDVWALKAENHEDVHPETIDRFVGRFENALGDDWYLEALPNSVIETTDLKYDEAEDLDSKPYRRENGLLDDDPGFR